MAVFESHYKELGFYVKGEHRKFNSGRYATESEEEIEVLSGLVDVTRVDKPEPKAEEKPAPKPKAPAKKASGK